MTKKDGNMTKKDKITVSLYSSIDLKIFSKYQLIAPDTINQALYLLFTKCKQYFKIVSDMAKIQ